MIKREDAIRFLGTLSTDNWREFTHTDYRRISEFVKSDGCTGVSELYHNGCVLHDFCYRTHLNFKGEEITKDEADKLLRDYIWSRSVFGYLSPLAWIRWIGVKYLAERPWKSYGQND